MMTDLAWTGLSAGVLVTVAIAVLLVNRAARVNDTLLAMAGALFVAALLALTPAGHVLSATTWLVMVTVAFTPLALLARTPATTLPARGGLR